MPTSQFQFIASPGEVARVISLSVTHYVVIFKHSPTCPISHRARAEMETFLASAPASLRFFLVDVIAARPASQAIATLTQVRHESPQVLFLAGEKCLWQADHGQITAVALQAALSVFPGRN